jgi:hypothetical protein
MTLYDNGETLIDKISNSCIYNNWNTVKLITLESDVFQAL